MADENESDNHSFNPFSFSKFLQRNADPVQENVSVDSNNSSTDKEVTDDYQNPFSIKNYQSVVKNSRKLQIVEHEDSTEDTLPTAQSIQDEKHEVETDSDFEARSVSPQMDSYILMESNTNHTITDSQFEMNQQLEDENQELKAELRKVREEFLEYRQTANRRISGLQKELEKVRKKEADETKTLEDVVHMVEENLRDTTTRALKAEATVSRMNEELKFYKEGSVSKMQHDKLLSEQAYLLNTIQEKSRNAAYLMRTAAEKTEPHVRQLQSGIASLRFLAEQFEDISAISEIPKNEKKEGDVT